MTIKRRKRKASDKAPCLHASGRWVKKVYGTTVYFTHERDDPDGKQAQATWNQQSQTIRQNVREGRKPFEGIVQQPGDGMTLADLCNQFLAAKERFVASGELTQGSWEKYRHTASKLLSIIDRNKLVADLTKTDFATLRHALANGLSPGTLKVSIVRVKTIFRWGSDEELIAPMRFGKSLQVPSAAVMRRDRNERPPKLFERDELLRILAAADPQLRTMILLGVNAGMGPADLARMKSKHINLVAGWMEYPRPKTGELRRAKLWPETVKALSAEVAKRPKHSAGDLVFLGLDGKAWLPRYISDKFSALVRRLDMAKQGVGLYALRHVFQTVAEGTGDLAAIRRCMGHTAASNDMASVYRERISDERLEAVASHVHDWLYPPAPRQKRKPR